MEKTSLFIDDKLRIAITNSCNFSCYYCHNDGQGHDGNCHFLSLDYIRKIVDFVIKNNILVKKINITGGEPLMHPQFFEIVDELAKIKSKIRLNTNGSLLTRDLIDRITADKKVSSFKIGLDSFLENQSKFNIYKVVQDTEELKEIIAYASKKASVVLNCVVTKKNYGQVPDIIELCKKLGVLRLKVIDLHDFDARKTNADENFSNDYKTGYQLANTQFDTLLESYSKIAKNVTVYDYLGRVDVLLKDDFQIRFVKDMCQARACGNLYSSFNAKGELIICQKACKSLAVDFSKDAHDVIALLEDTQAKICNKLTHRFDMYETNFVS